MLLFKKMSFVAIAAASFALAGTASAKETASATISSTPIAGGFQYNIALTNTSTDGSDIGTLWFSWIPGFNYMEVAATNPTEPSGWEGNLISGGGNSIQWVDNTGALLAPGNTDQFSFDSTEPLSQLESPSTEGGHLIETTAFIYTGQPFSDAGTEIVVPEPASLGLLTFFGGGLLLRRRRAS